MKVTVSVSSVKGNCKMDYEKTIELASLPVTKTEILVRTPSGRSCIIPHRVLLAEDGTIHVSCTSHSGTGYFSSSYSPKEWEREGWTAVPRNKEPWPEDPIEPKEP